MFRLIGEQFHLCKIGIVSSYVQLLGMEAGKESCS